MKWEKGAKVAQEPFRKFGLWGEILKIEKVTPTGKVKINGVLCRVINDRAVVQDRWSRVAYRLMTPENMAKREEDHALAAKKHKMAMLSRALESADPGVIPDDLLAALEAALRGVA